MSDQACRLESPVSTFVSLQLALDERQGQLPVALGQTVECLSPDDSIAILGRFQKCFTNLGRINLLHRHRHGSPIAVRQVGVAHEANQQPQVVVGCITSGQRDFVVRRHPNEI